MQNVGKIQMKEHDGTTYYEGRVSILGSVVGALALVPSDDKRSPNSPDFTVKVKDMNGAYVESGAAWRKPLKAGGDFFSITIDNPSMPHPVYVSAFPVDGSDEGQAVDFDVIWSRAKKPNAAGGMGGGTDISAMSAETPL